MTESRFTAGTKYDAGKPPMELIPWEAMTGVAQVLDFGRVKYAAHNWRGGFQWGRLAGACLRHVFAWLSGQDNDPESGLSHIDHAICCLMFLSAHIKSALGTDDRHKTPVAISNNVVPELSTVRWGIRDALYIEGTERWESQFTYFTQEEAVSRASGLSWPVEVFKIE